MRLESKYQCLPKIRHADWSPTLAYRDTALTVQSTASTVLLIALHRCSHQRLLPRQHSLYHEHEYH